MKRPRAIPVLFSAALLAGCGGGPEQKPADEEVRASEREGEKPTPRGEELAAQEEEPVAQGKEPADREGSAEPADGATPREDPGEADPEPLDLSVRSRWIEVGGERLHLLEAGATSERAVLLLHGARFRAETWRELGSLAAIAATGRHVLALDLPGFGESPRGSHDCELAAVLDALELTQVVVVSPSMSGSFAFPLLLEHPERLAGFVAVAPVGIAGAAGELQGCEVPALLLWGSEDRVVPPSEAERLAACFTDARKVVFDGAPHPCYLEATGPFHDELLEFLDGTITESSDRPDDERR